jgi:hypothetical protein
LGKSEGKKPITRPRHRWKNNIKTDIREIGWDSVDCFDLAEDGDK